jgi:hypothetical protein
VNFFFFCIFFKSSRQVDMKNGVRDVSTGATGATTVAPKFSVTLTLFKPGGADSAHHCRGRTKNFHVVTSLGVECYKDLFGYFNALKTNCGMHEFNYQSKLVFFESR